MKKLNTVVCGCVVILVLTSFTNIIKSDCSYLSSYADDTYSYAMEGHNSSNYEEAKLYAKKTMNSAKGAESAAGNCNCDDAKSEASDTYDYAKRAYSSSSLSDVQYYLKKAASEAEDIQREAKNCE